MAPSPKLDIFSSKFTYFLFQSLPRSNIIWWGVNTLRESFCTPSLLFSKFLGERQGSVLWLSPLFPLILVQGSSSKAGEKNLIDPYIPRTEHNVCQIVGAQYTLDGLKNIQTLMAKPQVKRGKELVSDWKVWYLPLETCPQGLRLFHRGPCIESSANSLLFIIPLLGISTLSQMNSAEWGQGVRF